MKMRQAVTILVTLLVAIVIGVNDLAAQESEESSVNPLTQNPWVQEPGLEYLGPNCGDFEHHLSGTLEGSGKAVGLIAGVRWGQGTLTLTNGEQYQLTYKGLKLLDVGVAGIEFTGKIYNLSKIEDVIGTYYGSSGGSGLVVGEGEVIVNNSRCVVITAQAKGQGIQLSPPGPGGFSVQLAPDE